MVCKNYPEISGISQFHVVFFRVGEYNYRHSQLGKNYDYRAAGAHIMAKNITIIPPAEAAIEKKNVGIYCRVSTAGKQQIHSLAAQVSYLTRYVMARPWFVLTDIYLDVGSGAHIEDRPEFQRLLYDVRTDKINYVITKSISRMGRNAAEILEAIRELKTLGVTVYFEGQGLNADDPDNELYISTFAAEASDENLARSENIRWGIEKRVESGESEIYNRPCYGYRKNDAGELTPVPEQAEVVRRIFTMYVSGMTPRQIATKLMEMNIPNPRGKEKWAYQSIESILANDKYIGVSTAFKTFSGEYPGNRRIRNSGEHNLYRIEDNHEAIIPVELFEKAKAERESRSNVVVGDDGVKRRRANKYSSKKKKE